MEEESATTVSTHGRYSFGKTSTGESSKTLSMLDSSGIFCRICHEGEGNEELLRPCKCCGSLEFVHHSCLLSWISRCGDLECEICHHRYEIKRVQRRGFSQWKLPPIGLKGWLHIILFMAFFAMFLTSVIWIIWSQTSHSQSALIERSSSEIKYAYVLNGIFILTALIGIIVDSARQFKRYFQRMLALNHEYIITDYYPSEGSRSIEDQGLPKQETLSNLECTTLLSSEINSTRDTTIANTLHSSSKTDTYV